MIGRGPGLDLTLSDADASRRHVEVARRGSGLWVKDLGSKNGALLDGKPLAPNKETLWPRSKLLSLGETGLGFDDPLAEALQEIEAVSDEKMRESDSVDPPTAGATGAAPVGQESRAGAAAPIASVPAARSPSRPRERGFRKEDLAIALLAIVELAASLLGLVWHSRMK